MVKKSIVLVLVLSMLVMLFAGCSDKPAEGGDPTMTDKPTQTEDPGSNRRSRRGNSQASWGHNANKIPPEVE